MAKKKGKGKKGGKGKVDNIMTWNEALLAYKINLKQIILNDAVIELKGLQTKNERHHERLDRLNEEQKLYIDNLLIQSHKLNKQLDDEPIVPKNEVTMAMKGNWEAVNEADVDLKSIFNRLENKEIEIIEAEKEMKYWNDYRDKGAEQHKKQVMLLEHEKNDMMNTFHEMKAHLQGTWDKARTKIINDTEVSVDQQKYIASQRAMSHMDKFSRQEVIDNEWLKREEMIHSREVNLLQEEVESLERENLEMMSDLFECNIEDLKISRNFFLTQFNDEVENLETEGILEMDLRNIIPEEISETQRSKSSRQRPKSAIQKAVEDKVLSVQNRVKIADIHSESEEETSADAVDENKDIEADVISNEIEILTSRFNFDDVIFDDYLKLGPLELKLLSVRGERINLLSEPTQTKLEQKAEFNNPKIWPVTSKMLNSTLKPTNRVVF